MTFKHITELWLVDAILSGDHFQNRNGKLTSKEEKKALFSTPTAGKCRKSSCWCYAVANM